MVMGFFRRTDERGKPGGALADASFSERNDAQDWQSFGAVMAESEMSSEDLLTGLGGLQERVATLLREHGVALSELAALKTERARISSLLEYESGARQRFEAESHQFGSENKELKSENSLLRLENGEVKEKLAHIQALHAANLRDLDVTQSRLRDITRELDERIGQYDATAALLKRAHQDLDFRNRELAQFREKYESERTAYQVLAETSRRETESQAREIERLNEDRSTLKKNLDQQEGQIRSVSTEATGLRQELAFATEKIKRLQAEMENQHSASSVEIAQLTTKQEAMSSKAELVEKLLITARGRAKMAEDELQSLRNELKEAKAEVATATLRAERLSHDLSTVRAGSADSESVRRELQLQVSDLTTRMRESETVRSKREREMEALKRDLDQRSRADMEDIRQLRSSNEMLRAEIRQLKAEVAILSGQLDVARGERGQGAQMPKAAFSEWIAEAPEPSPKPIIDVSDEAIRRAVPPAE